MLKIDVDGIHRQSRFTLQKILYSIPRPFFVRLSSGRGGIHIKCALLGEWDYRRYAYDDRMRIDLDEQRQHKGIVVHNLLFDVKNGRVAGDWWHIKNEYDIERFLDAIKPLHLSG